MHIGFGLRLLQKILLLGICSVGMAQTPATRSQTDEDLLKPEVQSSNVQTPEQIANEKRKQELAKKKADWVKKRQEANLKIYKKVQEGEPESKDSSGVIKPGEKREKVDVEPKIAKVRRPTPWKAYILRRTPQNLRLEELGFPVPQGPVFLSAQDRLLRPTMEINGYFKRKDWVLMVQNQVLQGLDEPEGFSYWVFLNGRINEMVFTAIGPEGQTEEETVYIYSEDAQELKLTSPWDALTITPHLSYVNYSQTGYTTYTSVSGAMQGSYSTFDEPDLWGVYGEGTFTALSLTAPSARNNPQIIDLRGDVSYNHPAFKVKNLKFQALLGLNYMTMLAPSNSFGFTNLIGMEAGVRVRYLVGPTGAWSGDFRYIPFTYSSLDENGLVARLSWSRTLENGHRLDLGGGWLRYFFRPGVGSEVNMQMFSVFLGYSL